MLPQTLADLTDRHEHISQVIQVGFRPLTMHCILNCYFYFFLNVYVYSQYLEGAYISADQSLEDRAVVENRVRHAVMYTVLCYILLHCTSVYVCSAFRFCLVSIDLCCAHRQKDIWPMPCSLSSVTSVPPQVQPLIHRDRPLLCCSER